MFSPSAATEVVFAANSEARAEGASFDLSYAFTGLGIVSALFVLSLALVAVDVFLTAQLVFGNGSFHHYVSLSFSYAGSNVT